MNLEIDTHDKNDSRKISSLSLLSLNSSEWEDYCEKTWQLWNRKWPNKTINLKMSN